MKWSLSKKNIEQNVGTQLKGRGKTVGRIKTPERGEEERAYHQNKRWAAEMSPAIHQHKAKNEHSRSKRAYRVNGIDG